MNTIALQLKKLGVVSEGKLQEPITECDLACIEVEKKNKPRDALTIEDLRKSPNMQSFKHTARTILERDISQIGDIIRIAHDLYDKEGGKKLFWILYQVRDGLRGLPPDKHSELLRRSFRKSGATPSISISNQKK